MKGITIGGVIAQKRRAQGVTQEELANHVGVSKAAVSKWESGQSYPDITLLPLLASYFGISVDDLIGYEAQMGQAQIRALYLELAAAFAEKPFEEVFERCRKAVEEYYSCWDLVMHMALLLLNHAVFVQEQERREQVLRYALSLFERVEQNADNASLRRQALHMRAAVYVQLNEPVEAIDLLEADRALDVPQTSEPLLVAAYRMHGDLPKATALLQMYIFQSVGGAVNAMNALMGLYRERPEKHAPCLHKALALAEAFDFSTVHPTMLLMLYLEGAQSAMHFGQPQQAVDWLERYAKLMASGNLDEIRLGGSDFFDAIRERLEKQTLGMHPPRGEATIRQQLIGAVLADPVFAPLEGDLGFERVKNTLKGLE